MSQTSASTTKKHAKVRSYDPAKSSTNHTELVNFIRQPLVDDIKTCPGIGEKNAQLLRDNAHITTLYQLISIFLKFKTENCTQEDMCDHFYDYLKENGITNSRASIVQAIASKAHVCFPNLVYEESLYHPSGKHEHVESEHAAAPTTSG